MTGLFLLVVIFAWLGVVVFLTNWLMKRVSIRPKPVRMAVALLIFVLLLPLPVVDEVIGSYQFEQYCKAAEEVKIFGAIPVGEDLYFPDGRWRRDEPAVSLAESNRIANFIDMQIVYETSPYQRIPAAMPILWSEVRIMEKRTGRLVATYKEFVTQGGWIGRRLEKPLVSRDSCAPELRGPALQKILLPFNLSLEKEISK